jgi:uncharacterized protein YndB with AHSA1/START domain
MKSQSYTVSAVLPTTPEAIYKAWMSGAEHAAMTGGAARVSARVGGKYTAWDDYINGKTMKLEPFKRIVQTWRTTEFPEDAPDSLLEITLKKEKSGTRITLTHTDIPPGQGAGYKKGWIDFYFKPMKEYFKNKK